VTGRGVALAIALCVAVAPSAAQAQEGDARALFQRGVQLLEDARFAEAASSLERSLAVREVPPVLYNLALAYRGAGRHRAAVDTFARYLRDEGTAVSPERRAAIERAVEELRAYVGSIDCRVSPSTAQVTVDGTPSACAGPIAVDPGEHQIEARAAGHASERRTLRINAGARVPFDVRLAESPAAATPTPLVVVPAVVTPPPGPLQRAVEPPRTLPPERPPFYTRGWFWGIVGGVAAAALITGLAIHLSNQRRDPPLGDALYSVEAIGAR
jgi:hypothetical protein